MKKTLMMAAALTLLGLSATVQAIPITGTITFKGGVSLDTASAGTATKVTGWFGAGPGPTVLLSSLSAGAVAPLTAVTFAAPWSFVSGPIAGFWSVGGYTFDLTSSAIFSQGGFPATVSVTGLGVLKHAGFTDTAGTWAFSTQDPSTSVPGAPPEFSFSAASGTISTLPDGGTTVTLLGAAFSGLALFRRKLAA